MTDLARTAPSRTIATGATGPASIAYLAICSQTQNSPNSLSDSPVGIYVDGVYVSRQVVGNLELRIRRSMFWGDSIPSNVIFRPDGTVSGLIDWTSAELGPSELDLA